MKFKHYIASISAITALLTACNQKLPAPVYTVGDADNDIVLKAGVSDSPVGLMTKAADENHGSHVAFTSGTMVALRVDGTWTGHVPEDVKQKTNATLGDASDNHNPLSTFSPAIFWDDYGTADPDNKNTGRAKGLTIYGAAVNGKDYLLDETGRSLAALNDESSTWASIAWNVGSPENCIINQKDAGWADYDLLTSNNVTEPNTYKFSQHNDGKLMEFTHAMTKVTVQLTAGLGFPRTNESQSATAYFEAQPEVTLKDFYYKGTVNAEAKTSTHEGSTASIQMHPDPAYEDKAHTATLDALVFPGNSFENATQILELTADGNTFKVTATELNKAIDEAISKKATTKYPAEAGDHSLQQAWNYLIKITVNKTDIAITATILNWKEIQTTEEAPKINVTATYGYAEGAVDGSTAFTGNYDLFRSLTKATGYDENTNTPGPIDYAARYTNPNWDKTIYWPDHQTHYFFRGVYPQVGTAASGTTAVGAEAVTTVSGNDVVAVANAEYTNATYPSDLAIAIPRKTNGDFDETCHDTGHTATEGICATEGVIKLNFEYAMSKIEIRLKSTAAAPGNIDMTNDNTTVEIIGGYAKARIKLSDGLHDAYADEDKGDYTLSKLETPVTDFRVTTRDAVVPQSIGNDVKFRVTVTTDNNSTPDTSDDKTDVYECQVNLIKVKDSETPVNEWAHGKHYIYELNVNKTAISTTATIKDWVTVNAEDDIWF